MGSIPGWLTGILHATQLKTKPKKTMEQAERQKVSTPITLDRPQIFQKMKVKYRFYFLDQQKPMELYFNKCN